MVGKNNCMGVMKPTASLEELLHSGYRYALSLTHHPANAEDILQDAWVAVFQSGGPHNKPYLFSAIRSRFINRHKRERLVPMVSIEEADLDWDTNDRLWDPTPPFAASEKMLETALSTLRPLEREALFLAVVEGYTAQEIGDLTAQPRGTVLSLIHRARQKLRHLLGEADDHEEANV